MNAIKKGLLIYASDVKENKSGYYQEVVLHQKEIRDGDKIFQYEEFWPFRIFDKERRSKKFVPSENDFLQKKPILSVTFYDRGTAFDGDKGRKYFVNYHLVRWEETTIA